MKAPTEGPDMKPPNRRRRTRCSRARWWSSPPRRAPGIGFATAKRCAEEGAVVVISDAHDRRLEEAAEPLAELTGTRPLAVACNVTDRGPGPAPLRHRRDRARTASTWPSTTPASGGTAPIVEMTDEQWSTVLDITLTGTFRCVRAELRHMYAQGVRGHRQQRLGARVAGPGRPGPLRGGQGRGDGPHPDRGGRGRGVTASASTRSPPRLALHPFLNRVISDDGLERSAPGRALRPGGRDLGGGQRHRLPGHRLLLLHERGDRLGLVPTPMTQHP